MQTSSSLASQLAATVRFLAAQHWSPATGGNYSARLNTEQALITQSGKDKRQLTEADLMICSMEGVPEDESLKPSAETALHLALYRQSPEIGAVLHTHSVTSTVLSRNTPGHEVLIQGFEMQKSLAGMQSHEGEISLPVFENTQNIPLLAEQVIQRWPRNQSVPGLLVRGHGLYAWGRDIAEAQRHVEGLEFLMACVWQERLLEARS